MLRLKIFILVSLCLLITGLSAAYSEKTTVLTAAIREEVAAEPGILGLDLLIRDHTCPVVQSVFQGSPAHLKGIQAGDTILEINGISTQGKSDLEIDRYISDVPGTPVNLKIQRGFLTAEVILKVTSLSLMSQQVRAQYTTMNFNSYDRMTP